MRSTTTMIITQWFIPHRCSYAGRRSLHDSRHWRRQIGGVSDDSGEIPSSYIIILYHGNLRDNHTTDNNNRQTKDERAQYHAYFGAARRFAENDDGPEYLEDVGMKGDICPRQDEIGRRVVPR